MTILKLRNRKKKPDSTQIALATMIDAMFALFEKGPPRRDATLEEVAVQLSEAAYIHRSNRQIRTEPSKY